jgi:hypothetical protein
MTPRAVAIIRNTMTTLEYKGFRIEVTSVGKGWRGAIFLDVSFRGEAGVDRAAEFAASVENDPFETSDG